jgi:hypothetical protein
VVTDGDSDSPFTTCWGPTASEESTSGILPRRSGGRQVKPACQNLDSRGGIPAAGWVPYRRFPVLSTLDLRPSCG